jgi:uncharacterized protein (TIGR03437 family)
VTPLAKLVTTPGVVFGSGIFGTVTVVPVFAGLSPNSVGLYQVNAVVPRGLASGLAYVELIFPDSVSNTYQVAVQ